MKGEGYIQLCQEYHRQSNLSSLHCVLLREVDGAAFVKQIDCVQHDGAYLHINRITAGVGCKKEGDAFLLKRSQDITLIAKP